MRTKYCWPHRSYIPSGIRFTHTSELPMTQTAGSHPNDNASEKNSFISLHQHYYSELEPGIYQFKFTQSITRREGLFHGQFIPKKCENIYTRDRTVFFGRDRFSFDKRWIKSCYPPVNEYGGTFKLCLPHVVLLDAALPWEWSAKKNWTKDVGKPVPWLALLVFTLEDIDEILADETIINVVTRPVEELLKDRAGKKILCYPTVNTLYAHENPQAPTTGGDPNDGDKKSRTTQTIDIPKALFNKVAPSFGDLPYLAHVRQVTTSARALKSTDSSNQGEYYSVVVANRLPRSTKTVVHLVSLLGMEDYLPGPDGANNLPEATQFVRLVTFSNWQFGVNDEARDFEDLVAQTLDVEDATVDAPSTLRLPAVPSMDATPANQTVSNALKMGYIAMNHKTRMGDQTISWYRGPFSPYAVADDLETRTARSADSLIRYDVNTGLYNVSYAAAWQLGRLLALRKIEVAQALHDWKIRQNLAAIREMEQKVIERSLPEDVMTMVNSARSMEETTPASLGTAVLQSLLRQEEQLVAETAQIGARASRQVEDRSGFPDVSASELRKMLNDESARSLVGGTGSQKEDLPESVKKFLGELSLFQGIPYNYLVPDERMLPFESLRFFHLDWNWCRCLRDGVLSIGRTNSSIRTLDSRNADYYEAEAAHISSEYRAKYLKIPKQIQARDFSEGGPVTGFIMHSTVVEDFPGMAVQAFSNPDRKNGPLETLHYETIGKNIKLFLCKGELNSIRFSIGSEELHYKVDQQEVGSSVRFRKKPLRKVDADGKLNGTWGGDVEAEIPFRVIGGVNKFVINIQLLAERLAKAICKDKAKFTAADFAIQMINGTPTVDYTTNPPKKGTSGAAARQVVIDSQPIDPGTFLSPEAEGDEGGNPAT